MTQDPSAKAREVVSEWLKADFRGDVSLAGRNMLEQTIAAALTEARNAALDEAAKVAEKQNDRSGVYSVGRGIAARIRQLIAPEREDGSK